MNNEEAGDGGVIRKAITVELRGRGTNCADVCTAANPGSGWGGGGGGGGRRDVSYILMMLVPYVV